MYKALQLDIIDAFRREYITETGRIVSETQTGCALALHFGLAPEKHRVRILKSLADNIARHDNHLSTGFVGTPYLCHALSENGAHDLAGTLFLKCDYPSWLYAVDRGATTIWERWNSIREDGSFDGAGMNSFNHYAYGSIGQWMYQKLAGLNIVEPGYKKSLIKPMPIKGITWVKAGIETPYGTLSCHWECVDHRFTADIIVPANTTANVLLPGREEVTVGSGTYHFAYDTKLELEVERYSTDTSLREVLEHPAANEFLTQHANALLKNPLVLVVADRKVSDFMASSPEIAPLLEAAIQLMNAAETI